MTAHYWHLLLVLAVWCAVAAVFVVAERCKKNRQRTKNRKWAADCERRRDERVMSHRVGEF